MRRALLLVLLLVSACGPKKHPAGGGEENAADADWYGNPAGSAAAGSTSASSTGGAAPLPSAAPVICGEVRLSGDVASALPSDFVNWWILIYAHAGGPDGPIVAAAKGHVPAAFPLRFCLGPKNVLRPGAAVAGPLWIGARLDDEGGPDLAPGDFDGIAKAPSRIGARDAAVTIDTFR